MNDASGSGANRSLPSLREQEMPGHCAGYVGVVGVFGSLSLFIQGLECRLGTVLQMMGNENGQQSLLWIDHE